MGATYPRGPRTPVIWQSFRFISQPKSYAAKMRRLYGDAVGFRSLLGRGLALFEASLAREAFAAPPDTFEQVPAVGGIFGQRAVIATSGALHKKQRKLLNPPFHGARIKALYGTMQRVIERHLARLEVGSVVKMTDVTQAMTLDVILETVFGASASEAQLTRGREVLLAITHGFSPAIITTPRLHTMLFPPWRAFTRSRDAFHAWVVEVMAMRRARGDVGDDLLGLFLATKYDDGQPMDDEEIRDQLITLLLAGHETSAIAIAWAAYWLAKEPAVLAKLRRELEGLSTPEQLVKHPYLNAVASESLRIEPIVTDVVRLCRLPLKIRDWTVPAGEHVAVMVGAILNDERVYPEPHRFRPERFLERTYHAGEFLPFGGGQRRCLGAAFAEAELALAIAAIATGVELELVDAKPERAVRRNITMGPARGVRVRVTKKRKSSSTRDDGRLSLERG